VLNIIGISAYYHDSACCLLADGSLLCAAEEERFSRVKHDKRLPWRAFRFCLDHAGITLPDIDCVAYYEDPLKKLERQIWMAQHPSAGSAHRARLFRAILSDVGRVEREIREILGYQGPIELVEHHQAHAASSFFFSGFEDAAILTADGVGEWATTSYGRGHGSVIDVMEAVDFPNSLGLLYSTITAYLGFQVNNDEYKVMGLAPYGEPRYLGQMRQLLNVDEYGQFRLNLEYFDFLAADRMYSDRLIECFGQKPRQPESEILPFHRDVARSLQFLLEEVLLEKAKYLHSQIPSENLCMAGGVALNCVANGRLLRDGPFRRLFVQPAASDAGGALGAAAVAHTRITGARPGEERLENVYLGPSYSSREIGELFAASSAEVMDFRGRWDHLLDATVDRLVDGRVVGWFSGRMEFGPRALGSRSILADPRIPDMRDRINRFVKKREAFRPFAPAILAEKASLHFDIDHSSPFMLETCMVKSPLALPAITHVDGSARIQTVDRRSSPRFAALLERFEKRTGCPILLNTSFNMRGEPIVCTPVDAIMCFVRSKVDCLVLEEFLLDRAGIAPIWESMAATMPIRNIQAVSHDVYTLV
jgi:carbamoyltransferase